MQMVLHAEIDDQPRPDRDRGDQKDQRRARRAHREPLIRSGARDRAREGAEHDERKKAGKNRARLAPLALAPTKPPWS